MKNKYHQGKIVVSDNWLFSKITPLISKINCMQNQIQNDDLEDFVVDESNCLKIIEEIKKIQNSKPTNFYRCIIRHFFLIKITQILGFQTGKEIITLSNLFFLNQATTSLINLSNMDVLYEPIIYIFCIMCLAILKTYFISKIDQNVNLLILRLRVISKFLIYDKALKVTLLNNNKSNNKHQANINTLITQDSEQIMLINYTLREFWQIFLLVTGCLIFLIKIDSRAGLILIVTMVFAQSINFLISAIKMKSEKKLLEYKDQRVELQTNVIQGIKQIKYFSWEEVFQKKIMSIRKLEFLTLTILKVFDGLCSMFWNNVSYVLLCTYLISSINDGKSLNELNVFSLIAVFNTLVFPLSILPKTINATLMASVSFQRIAQFLELEEIDSENYLYLSDAQKGNVIEIEELSCQWPTEIEQNEKKNEIKFDQNYQSELILGQYDEYSPFELNINSLKIKRNTLNFIIGSIGQGKSALINAILNEMQKINQSEVQRNFSISQNELILSNQQMMKSNNQITINGNLGYCSQVSWVQNMTIRENILFGLPYKEDYYKQILDVCQINKDLMNFDKQDLYLIGPDGKNISGGQKQRIALARALYQNCDIYLFDDIFSSLDVHVADAIFQKAIIELLINNGKTVLLITSNFRHLDQIPSTIQSRIIQINNGVINNDQNQIKEYLGEQRICQENIVNDLQEQIELNIKEINIKNDDFQLENENKYFEQQEQQVKINLDTWLTYFKSMNWLIIVCWIFFNFLMQGSRSLIDFWLKSELQGDDTLLHNITIYCNSSFIDSLIYLTLFAILITFIRSAFYVSAALKSAWDLFEKLNQVLMKSLMKFYDQSNTGKIINTISDDISVIDDDLSWIFNTFLENVSSVVGLSIGLIILEPLTITIITGIIVLYYMISKRYLKINTQIKRLKSINQGFLLQLVNETLIGVQVIRAFQKQSYFLDEFAYKLNKWIITDQCGERSRLWFGVRLNLISNLILISISILIILTLIFDIQYSLTNQALAITYSTVVLDCLEDLFSYYLRMESSLISIERVQSYFLNQTEDIDKIQQIEIQPKINYVNKSENVIIFKNLYLKYNDDSNFSLKNISLTIKQGQKIAFVGRTGSGKTSILNVLFRLYHHQSGQIIINGINTTTQTLRQLRSQLSLVPQFGFLYNASVKDNLDPLNQQTLQDIENLFHTTGLQIRGINSSNQQSYNANFIISNHGSNLSKGEMQILNFLRILLMKRDIICLDEATSNMDPKTDQLLHNLLWKFAQNKTLLVITHRLENIQQYDQIVVLDSGEIVEVGKYQDLIKLDNGYFNRLIKYHKKQMI